MSIVLTENMKKALKSIKRGLKGWDTTFPRLNDYNTKGSGVNYGRPKDVVKNVKSSSTSRLIDLSRGKAPKGSPADLQVRAAAHELKKRDQPYLKPEYRTKKG